MAKTNPLDSFVSPVAVGKVKLPSMPNLGELITKLGFSQGHAKYHEEMQNWHRQVEQIINERLQSKEPVPPGNPQ